MSVGMEEVMVVDCRDRVMGRLGSQVAKMLLNGNRVVLINSEKLFIIGHIRNLLANYKRRFELQDKANPEHSPYWSRRPDLFVKRVIRGMLPYKQPKGKKAFKLLRVYVGVPEEFKGAKVVEIKTKTPEQVFESTVYVDQMLRKLGYRG